MSMVDWFMNLVRAKDDQSSPRSTGFGPQHSTARGLAPNTEPGPITIAESAEVGGLNFAAAIRAHQAWKGRLLARVAGTSEEKLDYRIICRDDKCILGQWIHGAGHDAFGHHAVFHDVWLAHKEFHKIAGSVVEAMDSGQTDVARRLLRGDYLRVSVRVQGLLAELFINVKKESG
jgi:hypothetical protein